MSFNTARFASRSYQSLKVREEYFFPTAEYDGKFPTEAFIACEFWIGNIMGVGELREELRTITNEEDSLLL